MTDPINVNFSDIADAMGKVNESNKEGKKVYIKFGKDHKLEVVDRKFFRKPKAERVVDLTFRTIQATRGHFAEMNTTSINQTIDGLKAMRMRLDKHQREMSPNKRAILEFFGYIDKTDTLLKKIDASIEILGSLCSSIPFPI